VGYDQDGLPKIKQDMFLKINNPAASCGELDPPEIKKPLKTMG
jgi:hypothetical protein